MKIAAKRMLTRPIYVEVVRIRVDQTFVNLQVSRQAIKVSVG